MGPVDEQATGGQLPSREVPSEVAHRIRARGPIPFAEVVDLALYHPDAGFYATQGHAGRRGDFLTSAEVGPLFGAVVARALDAWWEELGRPRPFTVVEAGAGIGTLALAVAAAAPACADALTYVLVERSAPLRRRQRDHLALVDPAIALPPAEPGSGPRFVSLAELPRVGVTGVVVANELLDNLAFGLLRRGDSGWDEVRVGLDDGGGLVEVMVPAIEEDAALARRAAPDAAPGARVPVQRAAGDWLRDALAIVEAGRVVVVDYASTTAELARRPQGEWLRTYRAHERGGGPLDDLGRQDITVEVAVDQLAHVAAPTDAATQADFLRRHGIDELVREGRRIWHERAAIGDLEAVRARSRVGEAEALLDPAGLGGFQAIEWRVG